MKKPFSDDIKLISITDVQQGFFMFRNTSVRTFIMVSLFASFGLMNILVIFLTKNSTLALLVCTISVLTLLFMWFYMTYYLVSPINTVKKSIDEVTAGNLSVTIPGSVTTVQDG